MSETFSLPELQAHRDELAEEIADLELRLEQARFRMSALERVIDGIRVLNSMGTSKIADLDPATVEQGRSFVEKNGERLRLAPAPLAGVGTPDFSYGGAVTQTKAPIKRIRSTEMMTELLALLARPVTREEAHTAFMERYKEQIPETWRNPENALNNALNRSVDNGDVKVTNDGRFISSRILDV